MGMPRWPSMEARSAVSSPQTKAPAPFHDLDPEAQARAEEVVAQEAQILGVLHGPAHPGHGQGIFGPHIHVAFVRADGPGGDHHAFQDRVGVALHDGAVHEGARGRLRRRCRR